MISLRIKLRRDQVKQISNIIADTGIVILASAIIPSFVIEFKIYQLAFGSITTILFWYLSIKFLKYGSN